MTGLHVPSSDVAFTPAVKAIQTRKGSRRAYAHVEDSGGWRTDVDEMLAAFIGEQTSFFLATATADGQPYIQHRGGPPGFIRILDKTRWPSRISAATGSTLRKAIFRKIRRHIFS